MLDPSQLIMTLPWLVLIVGSVTTWARILNFANAGQPLIPFEVRRHRALARR